MPQFSDTSRQRLLTCDSRLVAVCSDAIACFDFAVIHGHRTVEEQNELYAQGRTKPGPIVTNLRGGQSIHNTYPSRAIDLCPWDHGLQWDDPELFAEMAGVLRYCAWKRRIDLQWGGHWTEFVDRPHFQVPRIE